MKKRVLHVLSSTKYSGAENVAAYIIKSLDDEYEMLYTSPNGPIKDSLRDRGVNYIPLEKLSIKELKRIINKFNPDIIHAHDFTATVKCAMINSKIPVISHIHQNPNWLKGLNKNSIILHLYSNKISHLIAVTSAIIESISSYKPLKRKSTVIENIVDVKEVLNKANYDCKNEYDLVFIGRLVDVKNPLRFINIISKVAEKKPNIKVGIIGDGDLKEECKNMIDELNLQDNIELNGYISNPFPILNNSKMLIMTSKSEGLPMTAIEALALGKPVITSNIDGIDKIIDYNCGVVCSNDDDYISSIINILENQDRYNKMSKSAKAKALTMFDIDKYKEKMIEVYNCVLS